MPLVHKSIDVRPEIWKRLRLNAEITGVALRDYLTYLIERSSPVTDAQQVEKQCLDRIVQANSKAGTERSQG